MVISLNTSASSVTATDRCRELNSSANIFITNEAFVFAGLFEGHVSEIRRSRARPTVEPFDDCDALGLEIGFESAGENLVIIFQSIKVQMLQLESAFVFAHQRECG